MDLSAFSAAMTARGCVGDGKNFCGTFNGYPFAATFMNGRPGGQTTFSFRLLFAQPVEKSLFKTTKARLADLARVSKVQYNDKNLFFVTLAVANQQLFDSAFDTLVAVVTEEAARLGMTVPTTCPVCKNTGCDSYAYQGVAYAPVHAACVQANAYHQQVRVQQNELAGSYGLGALGAFLGGLVGAIPTLLLYVFANMISGWLCALIPLGAYYGYKLLKGKMTRMATVIIIVMSVIIVPVFNYLAVAFLFLKEVGFFISVGEYISLYTNSWTGGEMLRDLGMSFLFTGLGILIVSGIITRGNSQAWNEATFSAATLRPIPGVAQPAAAPAPAVAPAPEQAATLSPGMADEAPAPTAEPAPQNPGELS